MDYFDFIPTFMFVRTWNNSSSAKQFWRSVNTTLVYLELKYDSKPVCSHSYPVPRVHEDMSQKEVKWLVILGIIKHTNDSKWGALSFAQPEKNTNCICFIIDLRNLNIQCKVSSKSCQKYMKFY